MGDWREHYDDAATDEQRRLAKLSLRELLARVKRRRLGEYHVIWSAIVERAPEDKGRAGWALYDFVVSDAPYLDRYNCARSLLTWLGVSRYDAADLTVQHRDPRVALADVAQVLEAAVGPRPVEVD